MESIEENNKSKTKNSETNANLQEVMSSTDDLSKISKNKKLPERKPSNEKKFNIDSKYRKMNSIGNIQFHKSKCQNTTKRETLSNLEDEKGAPGFPDYKETSKRSEHKVKEEQENNEHVDTESSKSSIEEDSSEDSEEQTKQEKVNDTSTRGHISLSSSTNESSNYITSLKKLQEIAIPLKNLKY